MVRSCEQVSKGVEIHTGPQDCALSAETVYQWPDMFTESRANVTASERPGRQCTASNDKQEKA
jgi:hypothetical protein